MRLRSVGWLIGVLWSGLAAVLAVPLVLALATGEPWLPFGNALALAALGGGVLLLTTQRGERGLDMRSAFLAVTATCLSACLIGAIPFATHPNPEIGVVDALFESVSGFTTTGATVLSGLDTLPRSFLLWRSITQWLGGMGMVVLGVAILPLLGIGGMQVYKPDAPGPTKDKMSPRIAETARILCVPYLALTAIAAGLFFATGMTLFDAICHAMTSIATGGFSTHDASFGYFDSRAIRVVGTIAMLAGGTSFVVLHRALTGRLTWAGQPELRAYIGLFGLAAFLITGNLAFSSGESFASFASVLEHASFQAASILTGSGFASQDFARWPSLSQTVLFTLCFTGGMAGSTTGGIKMVRIVLMIRLAMVQFFRLLHPHAIHVVRLGQRTIEDRILVSAVGFFGMWVLLFFSGAALLTLLGTDLFSSLSASVATLGNIGPGLGDIGPARTYAEFGAAAKLLLASLMILGRLEIYTVLIVLTPAFWQR